MTFTIKTPANRAASLATALGKIHRKSVTTATKHNIVILTCDNADEYYRRSVISTLVSMRLDGTVEKFVAI